MARATGDQLIPIAPDRPTGLDERQLRHEFRPTPTDPTKDPPVNAAKDGHYYDSCPDGCCRDVDRSFKIGGRDARGEEYLDAAIFHSPCGLNWSRTTEQGMERDYNRGVRTKYKAGDVGRFVSMPSARYRANFDLIDWSK